MEMKFLKLFLRRIRI